jgi:hypothetical protein
VEESPSKSLPSVAVNSLQLRTFGYSGKREPLLRRWGLGVYTSWATQLLVCRIPPSIHQPSRWEGVGARLRKAGRTPPEGQQECG